VVERMSPLPDYSKAALTAIAEEAKKEIARRSMAEFTLYTDDKYQMNWHHRLICEYLDRWVNKEIRRLMIFTAPRHGKSELVSRKLPAYIFGKKPDTSIISSSYSADLASRMNRDVQRIMDTSKYVELFPDTRLYGKNIRSVAQGSFLRNSDIFEIVDHRGVYRSAGVGGGITGMGGEYIIIDDPVKNREEANSATYRDKLWDWYTSTLYTRLEKDGCILVTLTRWHEDDLAGRLVEKMKEEDADQWTILSLPAICEEESKQPYDIRQPGEALWPAKYDEKELKKIKTTVGTYDWSALYQQRPQPAEGAIFKREWMNNSYKQLPHQNMIIQSWDLPFVKSEQSAKCAGLVMGRSGAQIYIIDLVNDKMEFTENVTAMRTLTAKHPKARAKVVENKANGPAIVSLLKKEIPGIVEFNPKGSKEERAISVTPYFEAGNVFFPDPSIAPWVHDLIEDLLSFPSGKFKDTVDALVQGILYLMDKPATSGPPKTGALTKDSYWKR
jgi:predicted phage terminase large subunit-like protein